MIQTQPTLPGIPVPAAPRARSASPDDARRFDDALRSAGEQRPDAQPDRASSAPNDAEPAHDAEATTAETERPDAPADDSPDPVDRRDEPTDDTPAPADERDRAEQPPAETTGDVRPSDGQTAVGPADAALRASARAAEASAAPTLAPQQSQTQPFKGGVERQPDQIESNTAAAFSRERPAAATRELRVQPSPTPGAAEDGTTTDPRVSEREAEAARTGVVAADRRPTVERPAASTGTAQASAGSAEAAASAASSTGGSSGDTSGDQQPRSDRQPQAAPPPKAETAPAVAPDREGPPILATAPREIGARLGELSLGAKGPTVGGSAEAARLAEGEPALRSATMNTVQRGLATVLRQQGGAVTMRLSPPWLGQVRVQMGFTQGAVDVSIETSTTRAHELLQGNLASLRTALEAKGLTVERVNVQLAPNATAAQAPGASDGGGRADQQQQNTAGGDHDASGGRSRGHGRDSGAEGRHEDVPDQLTFEHLMSDATTDDGAELTLDAVA